MPVGKTAGNVRRKLPAQFRDQLFKVNNSTISLIAPAPLHAIGLAAEFASTERSKVFSLRVFLGRLENGFS